MIIADRGRGRVRGGTPARRDQAGRAVGGDRHPARARLRDRGHDDRRALPAEASVAPARGPAAAPATIPKPNASSVAMPATRGEGTGQAAAGGRRPADHGARARSPCRRRHPRARARRDPAAAARAARRSSGSSAGRRPADRRTPRRAGPGVRGPVFCRLMAGMAACSRRGGRRHPRPRDTSWCEPPVTSHRRRDRAFTAFSPRAYRRFTSGLPVPRRDCRRILAPGSPMSPGTFPCEKESSTRFVAFACSA